MGRATMSLEPLFRRRQQQFIEMMEVPSGAPQLRL
jgi:hypothetical protein